MMIHVCRDINHAKPVMVENIMTASSVIMDIIRIIKTAIIQDIVMNALVAPQTDCTEGSCCDFKCTQCKDGYYLKDNKCSSCHSSCKTCDSQTDQNCVDCIEGLLFSEDGKCVGCDESCATCEGTSCNDANTCTKYQEYHFLNEEKCLKSCLQIGEGWGADDNFNYIKCNLDNCKIYDDACQCTVCNEGYYIISDEVTLIEYYLPCQLDNCKACNGAG